MELIPDKFLTPNEKAQKIKDAYAANPARGNHGAYVPDRMGNPVPNCDAAFAKARAKIRLSLIPTGGTAHVALAMQDGYEKYGFSSWLDPKVKITALEMIDKVKRHVDLFTAGEDIVPDSTNGAHHLACAAADLLIALDCLTAGKLVDDRAFKRHLSTTYDALQK